VTTWSRTLTRWLRSEDTAIRGQGVKWSGADLLRHAAGASSWLDSMGIARNDPVPALLTMTPDAVALMVAAAGSVRPLAPLAVRSRPRELAACLEDMPGHHLVAQYEHAELASKVAAIAGRQLVVLDSVPPSPDVDEDLVQGPRDADVGLVLHTSGTTGLPKAVPMRQDRMFARVVANTEILEVGPGDTYVTASPFHHIAGAGAVTVGLSSGASIVEMGKFNVERWQSLEPFGVTIAMLVPTMIEILLDAGVLGLPTLRVVQYGAAPVSPELLRRTLNQVPGVSLVQFFGQTEGSPLACLTAADHLRAAADRADLLTSVGRAAPRTELVIAKPDDTGVGEVLVRAPHVFREDEDGWLHTGDMGRLDDVGYLYLVGRQGDTINRAGENIYPLEVEVVLLEHPAVAEVAVVGIADPHWGEVVKAFVVPVNVQLPPDTDELQRFAHRRLSGFKVPTQWEFRPNLPRNATGKVLRKDLVARSREQRRASTAS